MDPLRDLHTVIYSCPTTTTTTTTACAVVAGWYDATRDLRVDGGLVCGRRGPVAGGGLEEAFTPPGSSKTAGGGTNQIFSRSIIVLLPTLRVNLISTPIRTSSIFRLSKLVSESGKELNDGCEFSKCGDGQPKKEKRDTDLK